MPNTKSIFLSAVLLICLLCAPHGVDAKPSAETASKTAAQRTKAKSLSVALVEAVRREDIKGVQTLLRQGANVNGWDEYDTLPLSAAVGRRQVAIARLLLSKGANPNAPCYDGSSLLQQAIQYDDGKAAIPRLLLDYGASIKGEDGAYALMSAVTTGNLAVAALLLARGVKVNVTAQWNDYLGSTALMIAASWNNHDMVRFLLDKGANIDFPDAQGNTALMHAARQSEDPSEKYSASAALKLLLDRGAKVEARNQKGETALFLALGRYWNVRLLLKYGARVDVRDQTGATPLIRAAETRSDTMSPLLEAGAEINEQDNQGETALMKVVKANFPDRVQILLGYGADLNVTDKNGENAVQLATNRVRPEFFRAFLRSVKLSEPHVILLKKSYRSFHLLQAATSGNAQWVKKLLEQKVDVVDVNARDAEGKTALWWAASQRQDEDSGANKKSKSRFKPDYLSVVRLLLEKGANPGLRSEEEYDHWPTPLMRAMHSLPIVQLLIKGGANIHERNDTGETALMLSAWHQNLDVFRFLAQHGGDVKARDGEGATLFLRTLTGLAGIPSWSSPTPAEVRALREAGADINSGDKRGYTALMAASHSKDIPAIKLLLANGASLKVRDDDGLTALHYACASFAEPTTAASGSVIFQPNIETVRLLLERGADVNARDKEGLTALIQIARYDFTLIYLPAKYPDTEFRYAQIVKQQAETVKIAKVLLQYGALVNACTKNGNTALKWARVHNSTRLIQLLKRAGAKD